MDDPDIELLISPASSNFSVKNHANCLTVFLLLPDRKRKMSEKADTF